MIRPIDLQNAVLSAQPAPAAQRAENGARNDAQAAQAAFAAEVTHRDETVAAATEVLGNKVGAKQNQSGKRERDAGKRKPVPSFEEVVDDAAGSSEEPEHIIDFTA